MALGLAKTSTLDIFLIYHFMSRLNSPFKEWKAYKLGVINDNGEILIPRENRTDVQDNSLKMFDMLVLRLKRLLATIPGGSSKLATWAASWMLIREGVRVDVSDEDLIRDLAETIQSISDEDVAAFIMAEEAPVNNVSGGNVAGANGDPPVRRKRFGQTEVFTVSTNVFSQLRFGKAPYHRYEKYVGDCPTGKAIREFGLTNPKKSIIIEDEKTGTMMYLRKR